MRLSRGAGSAVFADRVEELAAEGRELLAAAHPAGFETYFVSVIAAGDASHGLVQALASEGGDLAAVTTGDRDVIAIPGKLLGIAQEAGRIAEDVTREDVKRLVSACATGDAKSSARMAALVLAGMRRQGSPSA